MAYTVTGQKSGTVRLTPYTSGTVTNESATRSSKVTSNPIETGADINDHVVLDPEKLAVTGVLVRDSGDVAKLNAMWKNRDIISYRGRLRLDSAVIANLKEDTAPKNSRGYGFNITFQKVNITSAAYVPMGETPLMSQQDSDATPSASTAASTQGTQSAGRTTTASTAISTSAYADYVNSYNNKPASSEGPTTRSTPSYNGVS